MNIKKAKEDIKEIFYMYAQGNYHLEITEDDLEEIADKVVKKLTIPDVVSMSKCDCIHSGSCRYEEVILSTKDICRHKE